MLCWYSACVDSVEALTLYVSMNCLLDAVQLAESGRKVHIVMPDQGEYDRAHKV